MAAEECIRAETATALVRVEGLSKSYVERRWLSRERFVVCALDKVDLTIHRGRTLALVGESASGKSTLGRCLARLEEADSGHIWFEGKDLRALNGEELYAARRQIQLVFQDPAAALNPRLTATEIVSEPLVVQQMGDRRERRERALALMERVGLRRQWASRSPGEFSGGQRQRLAIARALALEPALLILDEALSALDLSIQAQMVNLLLELQASRGLAYLYITHDLSLIGHLADEVAVIERGKIVERATPQELVRFPRHAHSQALVAAIPALEANALGRVLP
jgi:peptide/nickel transport system ATP-binding protein/oligopeptide transport system ATP-binding protein